MGLSRTLQILSRRNKPTVFDCNDIFYNIKYPKERRLFKQNFVGIFAKQDLEHVKYPDKTSIKKYLKEGGMLDSTFRNSSHRKYKHGYSAKESSFKLPLAEIASLRDQVVHKISEINTRFDEYCSDFSHPKYKTRCEPDLKHFESIPQLMRTRVKILARLKWKKFRGISKLIYNWIQENIIFKIERVFKTPLIAKLAKPRRKPESFKLIKFCEKNKKNWVDWIEKASLPLIEEKQDFAEMLFDFK